MGAENAATAVLFLLQAFSTFALTGLIWFVQVVHYPLFRSIPNPHHAVYAVGHQRRTSWVVAPLMLLELATAVLALWPSFRPRMLGFSGAALGMTLVAVIWLSTALVQVPIHSKLLTGTDAPAIDRLVRSNWIRTIAWSARSLLLTYWLLRALR